MAEHQGEALKDPESNPDGLIAQLVQANLRDYQNITSRLIEDYQRQILDLKATLRAIRTRVNELFSGDYMPTSDAITLAVFYPDKSLVEKCRKSIIEDDGE